MKKIFILLLVFIIVFSLCSCSETHQAQKYAEKCWDAIGSNDYEVEGIYIMKYTSRLKLTGDVLETPMYSEIPSQGYVIIFYRNQFLPYLDSFTCFLNEDGVLKFTFDYAENDMLSEKYYDKYNEYKTGTDGKLALEYLENCSYILDLIPGTDDDCALLEGELNENTWYAFTRKQINSCID